MHPRLCTILHGVYGVLLNIVIPSTFMFYMIYSMCLSYTYYFSSSGPASVTLYHAHYWVVEFQSQNSVYKITILCPVILCHGATLPVLINFPGLTVTYLQDSTPPPPFPVLASYNVAKIGRASLRCKM